MMEMRSNASPMDFEWESKAPPNPNSPFYKATSALKDKLRTHNNLTSPTKPSTFSSSQSALCATPSRTPFGELDTPNSQFGLGSSQSVLPNPSASAPPHSQGTYFPTARTQLFPNTSSTQKASVADEADPFQSPEPRRNVNETPDTTPRANEVRPTDRGTDILTTPTERLLGRLQRGPKRVQKRPSKSQTERHHLGFLKKNGITTDDTDDIADSSEEAHVPRTPRLSSTRPPKYTGQSNWDHHLPILASSYLQLGFNFVLVSIVIYIVVTFIRTIQADVNTNVKNEKAKLLLEIEECTHKFLQNKCDMAQRVPALQTICSEWEKCMSQNPEEVGRARVSAHTFATILNSFIEPISYKAMFFIGFLIIGSIWVTNAGFSMYRAKLAQEQHFTAPLPTPIPHATWNPHTPFQAPPISSGMTYGLFHQTPSRNKSRQPQIEY